MAALTFQPMPTTAVGIASTVAYGVASSAAFTVNSDFTTAIDTVISTPYGWTEYEYDLS